MPVVGHAFYGFATALSTHPDWSSARNKIGRGFQTVWIGVAVVLAYVPDLVNHALQIAAVPKARVISHSLLFGLVASVLFGVVAHWTSGLSAKWMTGFAAFSIGSHDFLDLLQASDRVPFWPFSDREFGFGFAVISSRIVTEIALFGSAFLVFLIFWSRRHPGQLRQIWPQTRSSLAAYSVIIVVLALALTTDHLRNQRDDDLKRAISAADRGDYQTSLQYAKRAARWPSATRRAHLLTIEGEAHEKLGNRSEAEKSYLEAYKIDKTYFYAVADLARLYADSDLSLAERRKLVQPWILVLRGPQFTDEPDLQQTMESLERHLGYKRGELSSVAPPQKSGAEFQ